MTGAKFIPNPRAGEELGRTPEMGKMLAETAEKVAEVVRTTGPKSEASGEHYVDMIEVATGVEGKTLIGRVNAKKFTSWWLEVGTARMPALAPLRRAVESLGLKLVGGGRKGR